MAYEVVWTESAVASLVDAIEYTARDSPSYAAAFAVRAERVAASLASLPERGRRVPEFNDPDVRELPVGNWRATNERRREPATPVSGRRCSHLLYSAKTRKISAMGKLLERAIEEAHKLPENEQEAVGAWLLAEIESERRWDELFSRPPSGALKRMAEEALEEHHRGLTTPLDPDKL